jgi:hypothetical protein
MLSTKDVHSLTEKLAKCLPKIGRARGGTEKYKATKTEYKTEENANSYGSTVRDKRKGRIVGKKPSNYPNLALCVYQRMELEVGGGG